MGFVRTAEELERIEQVLGSPRFVAGRQLRVEFLTAPQVLARLLPPPLHPAERPLVSVSVGQWHSNAFGDFAGASVYLACSHEGVAGGYALSMWMDREAPLVFGREVFGEPKKLASVSLERDAERLTARVERNGGPLLLIGGEMEGAGPTGERSRTAFNFRARTAPDGHGLDGPAVLTRTTFQETVREHREGRASIELHGTVHDPLEELEIVSVLGGAYTEQDTLARCRAVATVDADAFLPFHHGHADDWLALDTSPAPERVDVD